MDSEELFKTLPKPVSQFLIEEICGKKYRDIEVCIKTEIRRVKTRRLILLAKLFSNSIQKTWYIYTVEGDISTIKKNLRSLGYTISDVTEIFSKLSPDINKVLFVTARYLKKDESENYGIILSLNKKMFLLADQKTDSKLGNVSGLNKLRFPPYLMKKISNSMKSRVVKIVYSVRSDITGVQGLDEIELRGTDVLNGFAGLLARLDVFKRITSFFGPPIEIAFESGLVIHADGLTENLDMGSLLSFIVNLSEML